MKKQNYKHKSTYAPKLLENLYHCMYHELSLDCHIATPLFECMVEFRYTYLRCYHHCDILLALDLLNREKNVTVNWKSKVIPGF